MTTYLLDGLHAAAVVVGENFHFGNRALGDVDLLRRMCGERGVRVEGLPLDGDGRDQVWSSSYIRRCLAEGDVAAAAEALGRPFAIRGYVVKGDQRGRELGYPTANVPVATSRTAVPADGVYAGWLRRLDEPDGTYLPAAISVGTNPTFDGTDRRVESYVLDRDDLELYGVIVEVAFTERLRGMVRFDVGRRPARADGRRRRSRSRAAHHAARRAARLTAVSRCEGGRIPDEGWCLAALRAQTGATCSRSG